MVRLCVMINLCYDVIMKELHRGEEKLPSFYDFTTIELRLFAYVCLKWWLFLERVQEEFQYVDLYTHAYSQCVFTLQCFLNILILPNISEDFK